MFDTKSLKTLEYDKILDQLATYAQSQGGKDKARNLVPFEEYDEVLHSLAETEEADRTLFDFSVNPSFSVDDIDEVLARVSKGAVLSVADILKVGRTLRVSRRLKKSIYTVNGVPILTSMVQSLYDDIDLENRIYDSFISETEVSDNASADLRSIRIRIRKLNDNVKTKLQSYITSSSYQKYLQDNIITLRGDRYVIPLKSECKGTIQGLIHDQSASGSTLYVEPMAIVELNNDLRTAKAEEQVEIERILRKFSMAIQGCADRLKIAYDVITDMDCIFAKANLAREWKAVKPNINTKGVIKINNGRHPLIDKNKVVPVSLSLNSQDKLLLITGPNTGGKTVTLKLVGLSVLLAMSGIYIPAKSADIAIFDGVYCDIGDEQSIEQSLSTFSGHIRTIIEVLDKITDKSLVLFDELGAGTDPSEGAALAVSICERVLSLGAKSFVTSHFNDLKEFALITNGVVCASMEFNVETLSPTYKLVMGAVGCSNALDIAKKLGLDEEIINKAKNKVSPEKRKFDEVLNAAEETRRKAQQLVQDASLDRAKAREVLIDAEKEKAVIAQKKEKLDETIRRGTKNLIENSVEEANDIIFALKEILSKPEEEISDADLFDAHKLKKKLENMSAEYDKESVVEDVEIPGEIKIGDNVWVKSLGKKGKLVKTNSRGEGEVSFGKIVVKVKKNDYYKVK
ncbi:MAG: endonuclease MutS2 [Clostridia bacterium]|nr:endonuclease MutS2 [Clostridia bacterium]